MRVLPSMGVVTPKGSGHSNSPWAFYLQWEWSLPLVMGVRIRVGVAPPRAMGVLYSVGVVTPSLNDSTIYFLETSYIPTQIL